MQKRNKQLILSLVLDVLQGIQEQKYRRLNSYILHNANKTLYLGSLFYLKNLLIATSCQLVIVLM